MNPVQLHPTTEFVSQKRVREKNPVERVAESALKKPRPECKSLPKREYYSLIMGPNKKARVGLPIHPEEIKPDTSFI